MSSKKADLFQDSSSDGESSENDEVERNQNLGEGTSKSVSPDSKRKKTGFKINEKYAEHYDNFREKEVFQRLKAKYGEDAAKAKLDGDLDGDESSTSESEDDSADELTEEVEKDFYRTLSMLKNRDPRIYDGKTEFFRQKNENEATEKSGNNKKSSKKKDEKMTLADLERKVILEKGGRFEELEDEQLKAQTSGKSYVEEMRELKEGFKSFVQDSDDDEENEGQEIFSKKAKTTEEVEKEEKDYKAWLKGQKSSINDAESDDVKDMKGLKNFWSSKNISEDDKFLRDYILNRGYLAKDDIDEAEDDEDNLSEDEKTLERMENFEHKYNFRFEEPDQDFIKRYPRTIKDTLRAENNSRKRKREEAKDRKEKEKEKKREELKQLKALKRKEIEGKIEKLKKIAGDSGLKLEEGDLEADFDPDKYDKRMSEIFANFDEDVVDDEKPVFSDLEDSDLEDELEVDNWDDWTGEKDSDEDENEDCDNDDGEEKAEDEDRPSTSKSSKEQTQQELVESTIKAKKRKKSKFAEVVEKAKPAFDPKLHSTYQKYLDEYYKLDFEDLVGDLPCRFKYRDVQSNDFGLSTDEILSAPDRELNAWCSLKKTCMFRSKEEENSDLKAFADKAKNVQLKQKLLPSLFSENPEAELEAERLKKSSKAKKAKNDQLEMEAEEEPQQQIQNSETSQKKKKKKNKKKKKADGGLQQSSKPSENGDSQPPQMSKNKKNNKKWKNNSKTKEEIKKNEVNAEIKMSDDRLKAYGINPNQFKRKIKNKKYLDKD